MAGRLGVCGRAACDNPARPQVVLGLIPISLPTFSPTPPPHHPHVFSLLLFKLAAPACDNLPLQANQWDRQVVGGTLDLLVFLFSHLLPYLLPISVPSSHIAFLLCISLGIFVASLVHTWLAGRLAGWAGTDSFLYQQFIKFMAGWACLPLGRLAAHACHSHHDHPHASTPNICILPTPPPPNFLTLPSLTFLPSVHALLFSLPPPSPKHSTHALLVVEDRHGFGWGGMEGGWFLAHSILLPALRHSTFALPNQTSSSPSNHWAFCAYAIAPCLLQQRSSLALHLIFPASSPCRGLSTVGPGMQLPRQGA